MKKVCLLFLFPLISFSAYSQRNIFRLTDTSFTIGSVYTSCYMQYDLEGRGGIREESWPCLDSLADFMKKHPEIIFEIGSYTDQRGGDSTNIKLSQDRAGLVKQYLIGKGVMENNIAAVGYGEQFPLIPQSQIDTAKTKVTKERLYQQNRRTEIRILYVYESALQFNDTVFSIGGTMRPYIFFDLGRATIRPECFPLLDSIAIFLKEHPQLTVEISNHSDTRASDKSSSRPTLSRAKAVCDYLISKGVPASQLIAVGAHDTRPIITEKYIARIQSKQAKEELHRLNRRTEIKIIKID